MTEHAARPHRQLLAFRFPPGSGFEGQLVGALERIESGGALRIRDAFFVSRSPGGGELTAVAMSSGGGAAGLIGTLLSFRLDAGAREQRTREALDGPMGPVIRDLGEGLQAGGALAALLVEHAWFHVLAEAIERIGGTEALDTEVQVEAMAEASDQLAALVSP